MMVNAARLKDSGERNDVEAGLAKYLASECGGHAGGVPHPRRLRHSKEYQIERLMREAPFLLIGEGTREIQKTIISRELLREYQIRS
jgi:alkylation response protein AidB-like acyl-CoA dehydrogenase